MNNHKMNSSRNTLLYVEDQFHGAANSEGGDDDWTNFINDLPSKSLQDVAGIRPQSISPAPLPLPRNDSNATLASLNNDFQRASLQASLAQELQQANIVNALASYVEKMERATFWDSMATLPEFEPDVPIQLNAFEPPWMISQEALNRSVSASALSTLESTLAQRPRSKSATSHRPTLMTLSQLPSDLRHSIKPYTKPPTPKPMSPVPVEVKKSQCDNCQTTKTPIWRKNGDELLCNACGLYFKTHQCNRKPPKTSKTSIEEVEEVISCTNCQTTTTPLWRRTESGIQCNACGIYEKHHGIPRPIKLNASRRLGGTCATLQPKKTKKKSDE
jgi:hypothetical protein